MNKSIKIINKLKEQIESVELLEKARERTQDEDSCSDFKDWAQDAPYEFVSTAVDEWRKGNPSDDDIADVLSIIEDNSA